MGQYISQYFGAAAIIKAKTFKQFDVFGYDERLTTVEADDGFALIPNRMDEYRKVGLYLGEAPNKACVDLVETDMQLAIAQFKVLYAEELKKINAAGYTYHVTFVFTARGL